MSVWVSKSECVSKSEWESKSEWVRVSKSEWVRTIWRNGINTSLKISQLNNIVLHVNVNIRQKVSETTNSYYEYEQVRRG